MSKSPRIGLVGPWTALRLPLWPLASLLVATLAGCPARVTMVGGDSEASAGVLCNGTRCAPGEDCCLTTRSCFAPSVNGACQIPVDGGVGSAGTTVLPGTVPIGSPCTAHSQCVDGAYCQGSFCASVGFCQARDNCATCGPSGTAGCRVCGCDGVNYPSIQAACAAGVRVAEANSCGSATVVEPRDSGIPAPVRIGCGTDAQCPSGQSCCAITGHCYDPADCPGCCTLPPPGTSFPCVRDSQCYAESEYCGGPGGCGAPGGCARRGVSQCGPELALVCGCDGRTYRNAGCAANAGVRLAHDGACACGAGSRCVAGQYCAGDGCDTPGTCIDIPATCDGEIAPVCGCDGRSYTNARCASVGGTRVATTGQCH